MPTSIFLVPEQDEDDIPDGVVTANCSDLRVNGPAPAQIVIELGSYVVTMPPMYGRYGVWIVTGTHAQNTGSLWAEQLHFAL